MKPKVSVGAGADTNARTRLALRRARRRRISLGAALVEAAVAIPFYLVVFAGIVLIGRVYETKLDVMRATKTAAWTYAMSNCDEAGDPVTSRFEKDDGAPSAGRTGGDAPAPGIDLGQANAVHAPGGDTATRSLGTSTAQATRAVTANDSILGRVSKSMSSRNSVMCNEAPHDGTLLGAGHAAWDYVTRF